MKKTHLIKLVRVGNSQGIRIPQPLLRKYRFTDSLIMEETEKGLLLRSPDDSRLSWEDTFKSMAKEKESWLDWDSTLVDGLD